MELLHLALVNTSEENSDRFYIDILGCEKKPPKHAPADLMRQLFNLDQAAAIINYVHKDGLVFEIFVTVADEHAPLSHACLSVENRAVFLNNCEKSGVPIRRFLKEDGSRIVFIEDYDRNLFEIKERN